MACMHCTDAPCASVCPVDCFLQTSDGLVLHSKELCIGCGYCFFACPSARRSTPRPPTFRRAGDGQVHLLRRRPRQREHAETFALYGRNRWPKGSCRLCAEMCSTKALLAGDGEMIATIYRERVLRRGYGSNAWGWSTAYPDSPLRWRRATPSGLPATGLRAGGRHERVDTPPRAACGTPRAPRRRTVAPDRLRPVPRAAAQTAPAPSGVGSNAAQDRGVHSNPSRAPDATEQQLLDVLRRSAMPEGKITGSVYIPDARAAVLVQPEGRMWRDFRVGGSRWTHGVLFALAILAVLALAVFAGTQRYRPDPSGTAHPALLRLRPLHPLVDGVSFVVLALTGLNVVWGRVLLQPWMGDAPFSTFSAWAIVAHNFTGFAFILGILMMAGLWMGENLFRSYDWACCARAGASSRTAACRRASSTPGRRSSTGCRCSPASRWA